MRTRIMQWFLLELQPRQHTRGKIKIGVRKIDYYSYLFSYFLLLKNFLKKFSPPEQMFWLVSVDVEDFNPVIITLSSPSNIKHSFRFWCLRSNASTLNPTSVIINTKRDSPVSFPITETAVSTDAVCTDFEMVKNNLNLKTNEIDSVKFKKWKRVVWIS